MTHLRVGLLAAAAALIFWLEGVSRGVWTAGPFGLSLTTLLLTVIYVGTLILAGYVSAFLVAAWLGRDESDRPAGGPDREDPVDVIVASRDEGSLLVSCLDSIIAQDHPGPVDIWLVIGDRDDSSWPLLCDRFPDWRSATGNHLEASPADNRRVHLLLAETDPKWAKLNLALDLAENPWTAFLDADHEARPDWISHSLDVLDGTTFVAVQSRRLPKETPTITGAWDSWQTHAGQEIVNAALMHSERGVLFTGTTALFRREAIPDHGFTESLCEDTWLSHDIWSRGGRITWTPRPGSEEEVPPDGGSFMRRRRRWARAHTHSLIAHLGGLLSAPAPASSKLVMITHGLFYVITALWLAVHVAWSLYYALQFPPAIRLTITGLALVPALWLTFLQRPGSAGQVVRDTLAGIVVTFVPATWLTLVLHEARGLGNSWPVIELPGSAWLTPLGFVLMLLTIAPVIVGQRRYRPGRTRELLVLAMTWPWGLLLTLTSAWYGLVDLIFAPPVWGRLKRGSPRRTWHHVADILNSRRLVHRTLRIAAMLLFVFAAVLANDEMIRRSAGRRAGFSTEPVIGESLAPDIRLSRTWQNGRVQLVVHNGVRPVILDTDSMDPLPLGPGEQALIPLHRPWSRHRLEIRSGNREFIRDVAAVAVELKGGRLHVNGEPFLIKGLVPIFPRNLANLTPDVAFARYRRHGINVLRTYHEAPTSWTRAARANGLLLIDQPDGSTWNQADPESKWSLSRLVPRYEALVDFQLGEPASLCSNFGNEVEIGGKPAASDALRGAFAGLVARRPEALLSYATFKLDHRYPLPLIGINTPETGDLYWNRALPAARAEMGAFYASEFGGFLSDVEVTPTAVRLGRIERQWRQLLDLDAAGAVFFYSHDNWSQPRYGGWNDPFAPEFPDDLRGVWDHLDRVKPELAVLNRLYADLAVELLGPPQERPLQLRISNRRQWTLERVRLEHDGGIIADMGTLTPGETRDIELDLPRGLSGLVDLQVRAFSHQGRPCDSVLEIAVASGADTFITSRTITGPDGIPRLWSGRHVEAASRSATVTINGIPGETRAGRASVELPLGAVLRPVAWDATDPGPGSLEISFEFEGRVDDRPDAWIILDGLASPTWKLIHGRTNQSLSGHLGSRRHYAEVVVDLAEVPAADRHGPWRLILRRNRNRRAYGREITLQPPVLLAPVPIAFGKSPATAEPLPR